MIFGLISANVSNALGRKEDKSVVKDSSEVF